MSTLDDFNKYINSSNIINKYDLNNWWLNNFDKNDRDYIVSEYPSLIRGRELDYQEPVQIFLTIAGHFLSKGDKYIANKFYDKAEELAYDIVSLHYIYNERIKFLNKKKNKDQKYLVKIKEICERQIKISSLVIKIIKNKSFKQFSKNRTIKLLNHKGFEQLAAIYYEQKEYKEVINLCKEAKRQGWSGDWNKIIQEAINKLNL